MLKTFNQTKTFYPFFLFLFTLFLTISLALPWVSAQEPPKSKPQPWHIDGIIAALDDGHDKVKEYAFWQLVRYEPQDLQAVIEKPEDEDIAEKAVNILKDKTVDSHIRHLMVYALVNLGEAGVNYIPDILNFLQDKTVDSYIRNSAAQALGNLGEASTPYIPEILNLLQDDTVSSDHRGSAVVALIKLGKASAPYIPEIFNFLQEDTVDPRLRGFLVGEVLDKLGEDSARYIPEIFNFLKNDTIDYDVRRFLAVEALGKLGEAGAQYIPEILNFIQDETVDSYIRNWVALALINIRKLELNEIVFVLNNVYEANQPDFEQWRFATYLLSGGTEEIKMLLKWLGYPQSTPTALNYEEGTKTLELFLQVWENAQDLPRLQTDLAEKIALVTSLVSWKPQDIDLLRRHSNNLKAGNFSQADALESVILNLKK